MKTLFTTALLALTLVGSASVSQAQTTGYGPTSTTSVYVDGCIVPPTPALQP
jgi:hypothetical protein